MGEGCDAYIPFLSKNALPMGLGGLFMQGIEPGLPLFSETLSPWDSPRGLMVHIACRNKCHVVALPVCLPDEWTW